MFRVFAWSLSLAVLVVATGKAAGLLDSKKMQRPDCPGRIVCPLTGEEICKDRCPLRETARMDCPGKILCPLTGEPVCADRCPLQESGRSAERRPCCRNQNQHQETNK